ncbi:hypothetical protein JTB14_029219 [Gonioctena quinquepunctata]|nr:hypothetical protein JTB14_029219 [Gonioctena quinquepunctata]
MENSARSRRKGAGVNKSLSADYDWPERFGRGIGEMENPRKNESHITIEKEKTSEKSKLSKSAVSLKSHTSARILQKNLNYETEKKRQEIEMEKAKLKRQEIEMEKAKLENQLRLLQLEHDLQEEEIRSVEEERQSQKLGLEDVQSSLSRVQEWVNNSEENGSIRNRSNSQPSITKAQVQGLQGKPRENGDPPGQCNDIQLLCQTINNLLKRSSNDSSNNFHDKFLARQIIDKDFPIFCGNPEEWPLFYEQYERVCKMCSFSQEEIMIKLRKCLREEAKSAVAGMLLASENVQMRKLKAVGIAKTESTVLQTALSELDRRGHRQKAGVERYQRITLYQVDWGYFYKIRKFTMSGSSNIRIRKESWEAYHHLKNLPITDFENERPMLLIGQDNINLVIPRQIRSDYTNERFSPIATKCKLGWSLHGPNNQSGIDMIDSIHVCSKKDELLHDLVKQSFSLDSFGISPPKHVFTMEEKKAIDKEQHKGLEIILK